jgi:hypothetical protein
MGMFMATLVVFLLFVVVSQSVGYYRSRWQLADVEGESGGDVRRSAAVGIASGLIGAVSACDAVPRVHSMAVARVGPNPL